MKKTKLLIATIFIALTSNAQQNYHTGKCYEKCGHVYNKIAPSRDYLAPESSCDTCPLIWKFYSQDTSTIVWGYYIVPGVDWKSILLEDTTNTIYLIK